MLGHGYEAEGGTVRREMFADEEQGTYIGPAATSGQRQAAGDRRSHQSGGLEVGRGSAGSGSPMGQPSHARLRTEGSIVVRTGSRIRGSGVGT